MIDLNIELEKIMNGIDLDLLYANKEARPDAFETVKDSTIERLVKLRYTPEQEIGIQRQKERKPEKFAVYDAYVDECIRLVNERFGKGETA
jgi:hypothetical protein